MWIDACTYRAQLGEESDVTDSTCACACARTVTAGALSTLIHCTYVRGRFDLSCARVHDHSVAIHTTGVHARTMSEYVQTP